MPCLQQRDIVKEVKKERRRRKKRKEEEKRRKQKSHSSQFSHEQNQNGIYEIKVVSIETIIVLRQDWSKVRFLIFVNGYREA